MDNLNNKSQRRELAVVYIENHEFDIYNYNYDFYTALGKRTLFLYVKKEAGFLESWRQLWAMLICPRSIEAENCQILRIPYLRLVPFAYRFKRLDRLNRMFTAFFVRRQIRRKKISKTILIFSRPDQLHWLGLFNETVSIYDVRDSYVHYPSIWNKKRDEFLRKEDICLRKVDGAICVSEPLFKRASAVAKHAYHIPSGVNYEFFDNAYRNVPVSVSGNGRGEPILLLIGSLDDRVNFQWLKAAVEKIKNCRLRLVGPIKVREKENLAILNWLKIQPTVEFEGRIEIRRFPDELAKASVTLLPYVLNDWTKATSPLKLFQYLSFGKPIVSSAIPQCEAYGKLVYTAETQEEFLHKIRAALEEKSESLRHERRQAAREASWEKRADAWVRIMEELVEANDGVSSEKTLLIARTFLPVVGGIETFYHQLSNGLGKRMIVLTDRHSNSKFFDGQQPYHIQRCRLRYEVKSSLPLLRFITARFEEFMITFHVLRMVRRERPGSIVIGDGWLSWLVPLLKSWTKARISVFFHGKEIARMKRLGSKKLLESFKQADCILVPSHFTRKLVESSGLSREQIRVLHPGVDTELFRPLTNGSFLAERFNLRGNKVLLSISRLSERKGIDKAIASLPAVLNSLPNLVYIIVGDGPERSRLEKQVRELGLDKHVVFAGRAPAEDLPKFYNAADLFILPNRYLENEEDAEGFGIVFLEASACGKAVIGGKNGGTEDAILDKETGLLVNPENKDELAQAIVSLLNDEEKRIKMGQLGYKRAHGEFNWPSVQQKFKRWVLP